MPRQARLDAPGVLHHVMARGIERRRIFRDDLDLEDFVRRFSTVASSRDLMAYAWSLVPNHFHLLVRTGKTSLSQNMRSLMSGYAGYFNRRHNRHGHVFQNRFKSIVCEEELYLLELVRYLHLNPLRAGVVKNIQELDCYPYCGHSALLGRISRPWQETEDVLGRFSDLRGEAMAAYREFVLAGVNQGRRPELMGGGLLRSQGGWVRVSALRRGREAYRSDERILGSSSFVESILREAETQGQGRNKQVDLSTLVRRISQDMAISQESLRGGGRSAVVSRARAVVSYVWTRYLGRSGREVARELGVSPQAIYAASCRVGQDIRISSVDLERWCR